MGVHDTPWFDETPTVAKIRPTPGYRTYRQDITA
jgi:hypothetical protein